MITVLRIPYLCHFGSSSFVLPIRPKYGILNRVIRVLVSNLSIYVLTCLNSSKPYKTCLKLSKLVKILLNHFNLTKYLSKFNLIMTYMLQYSNNDSCICCPDVRNVQRRPLLVSNNTFVYHHILEKNPHPYPHVIWSHGYWNWQRVWSRWPPRVRSLQVQGHLPNPEVWPGVISGGARPGNNRPP